MTPQEIKAALCALKRKIGPKSDLYIYIGEDSQPGESVLLAVYARGMAYERTLSIYADDWSNLFTKAAEKWLEVAERHRVETVRRMALEIIRLTAEQGECTDAALRMTFSAEEIAQFGREATEDANKIAANGPFAITSGARENAA